MNAAGGQEKWGKRKIKGAEKSVDTAFPAVYSARLRCFGRENSMRMMT
jgi:hypothetical protein